MLGRELLVEFLWASVLVVYIIKILMLHSKIIIYYKFKFLLHSTNRRFHEIPMPELRECVHLLIRLQCY